jgi:protein-S-isoprenylcysteine O-methyltransferase Ste14
MSFHIIFAFVFFEFIIIRVVYHRKARHARKGVKLKESGLNMAVRAFLGLGYIGALVVYVFYPSLLGWAAIPLPAWARWVGAFIVILCVLLIWWVQWALDVQFDTTLHTQTDHQLITHGPYRWVRHPMYTTLFTMGLGWLLLCANWFIGAPLMAAILLLMGVRVKNEETVLIELFGQDYLAYMQKTGRFLPIKLTH